MKKILSMALALVVCGMTAIAPMNASAYEVRSAEPMLIETEAFQYDSGQMSNYDSWANQTNTDLGAYQGYSIYFFSIYSQLLE